MWNIEIDSMLKVIYFLIHATRIDMIFNKQIIKKNNDLRIK